LRQQLVDVDERAKENAQVHDSQPRIFLTEGLEEDGDEGEEGEDDGDKENDDDGETEPTSCVGHFDRLDVEHTAKPTSQARVYVFLDEHAIATWSGTPLLQQNEVSQR
jgi:hypothetical protein